MTQRPDTSALFTLNEAQFNEVALATFFHQAHQVTIYRDWLHQLRIDPASIQSWTDIPALPIEFFKQHTVLDQPIPDNALIFESSGTTGQVTSRHVVPDPALYQDSLLAGFKRMYGDPARYVILGLLPSYLERPHASLVYMVQQLMAASGRPENQFFLHNYGELQALLLQLEATGQPTLLIGVTFALLDFAEQYPMALHHTTLMETGGMKGRRKEMIREEVHAILQEAFQVEKVHSEYGMTELLSQAYSTGEGIYHAPPWMRIQIRDPYDPFTFLSTGQTGAINLVDLANWHSCSFLATADIGRTHPDGSFEVLGRLDQSDIRGCNLMAV